MAEQEYFKKALSNFTFDVASGGAIRHLADRGYTVQQIKEMLDFPTPLERVQQAVWQHFLDTGQVMYTEPEAGNQKEQFTYVLEYDAYGKSSYRRVTLKERDARPVSWRERQFSQKGDGPLLAFLEQKCKENGEEHSYVSCDFGLRSPREPAKYQRMLDLLEEDQREYILGLPWERKQVYHRLDERMRGIVARLYECGEYQGACYFVETKERIRL